MKKKSIETILYSSLGVVAMALILVAANLILSAVKQRIDLTAEKAYTLSDGTKAILKKLDTPVKVRFYFSKSASSMPVQLKTYAQRVEDLLTEYKQIAKGNLIIEKYDPEPDSDAEDSANLDGVEGQMTPTGEKIFLGLAVSVLDEKISMPFLSPERERLLEYDLSRAISRAVTPEKAVVGIMTSLPLFGQQMNPMMARMGQRGEEPWIILNELKRDFTVKQVQMEVDKIDDDIKVLLVIHPKGITEKGQFAIDQFILRGGKLIALLDPLAVVDNRNQNPSNPLGNPPSSSTFDKLLPAWGLSMDTSKVVADAAYKSQFYRGQQAQVAPAVLTMRAEGLNRDDIVTAQVDNLLLPFVGAFTGTPAPGLKQTILLKSSKESQLVEGFLAQLSGEQIMKDFKSGDKEHALAVRLTGRFKTAFPQGNPSSDDNKEEGDKPSDKPEGEKKEEKKPEKKPDNSLKESAAENAVILIADADFLYDQFAAEVREMFGQRIVIPRNGNLNLAQGAVEQLAGDSNLISVRSRATLNRPFTVVRDMQAEAEKAYQSKIKQLEEGLAETQRRLNELQTKKETGQRFILSPEQQAELEKFRKQESAAKKELKEVRKNLRREIDSLQHRIKWMNIAGMPFLVAVGGISLAVFKRKRTAAK